MTGNEHNEIVRRLDRIDAKLDRLHRVLFEGNGDSVMTRIRVLEESDQVQAQGVRARDKVAIALLVVAVSAVISFGSTLLQHIIFGG